MVICMGSYPSLPSTGSLIVFVLFMPDCLDHSPRPNNLKPLYHVELELESLIPHVFCHPHTCSCRPQLPPPYHQGPIKAVPSSVSCASCISFASSLLSYHHFGDHMLHPGGVKSDCSNLYRVRYAVRYVLHMWRISS